MASSTSRTHAWQTRLSGRWSNIGDASLQDALEASFLANSEGHRFTARGYTYEVDFGCMKQVNTTTKRKRSVQRVPDPRASLASMAAVVPKTTPATPAVAPLLKAPAAPIVTATSSATVPKMSKATTAVATRPAKTKAGGGAPSTPAATALPKAPAAPIVRATSTATPSAPAATAPPPKAPAPTLKASRGGIIQTGRVKTILKEKGFGFIVVKDEEVFFHVSIPPDGASIHVNDIVEVEVTTDGSGRRRAKQVLFLRKGSIFKTVCKNKCCVAKGDRHFADLCPLATSLPAPAAAVAPKPAVPAAVKAAAAPAPKSVSAARTVPVHNRFTMFADDSEDEDKHNGDSQDGGTSDSTACS